MTIKNANDAEAAVTETMADRLRAVQAEPWRKMRYVDENDGEAWDVFTNTFVPMREVKEPAEGEEGDPKSLDADLDTVQWLETGWSVNDIEEKISGKRDDGSGEQPRSEDADGGAKVKAEPDAGRAPSRAPPVAARRGRGRAGTAMDLS